MASLAGRAHMPRLVLLLIILPGLAAAATPVCVDVEVKSWTLKDGEDSDEINRRPDLPPDPYAIDPALYLERMVRYEVTHEVGFEAVDTECKERLTIELYPLRAGWTVFARYSGTTREEKIDHVQLDEFISLSQRLSYALLRDKPITDTINRENVLRADSESELRTIDGEGHFVFGLGTELKVGDLPTAQSAGAKASEELRFLTPLTLHLGYRGKYQAWGMDAFVRGSLGTNRKAERQNELGGHVDYDYGGALGLSFLRYFNAKGMTSFYVGGGAQFGLSLFSVIEPQSSGGGRESLYGGGLDGTLLVGLEVLRAHSVHFFVQLEAHAPAYRFETEVEAGGIDAYVPSGTALIGMVF